MTTVSTTNPIPPTGDTPTEVPFGISGSTALNSIPRNLSIAKGSMIGGNHGIFLTKFTITSTTPVGANLWEWDAQYPLGSTALTNQYYVATADIYYPKVPYDFWTLWYSAQCRVDYKLTFIPVKVGDSRASIDFLINYTGTIPASASYNVDTLTNDSFHKIIDDQDDQFSFIPPLIYTTDLINTCSPKLGIAAVDSDQPKFLPKTKVRAYLRSPYQPNMMQPTSFEILVMITPIIRDTQTVVGRSLAAVRPYPFEIA